MSTGNAQFVGTQPIKTADPGHNNVACGTNQAKAWGSITVTNNGSGVAIFTLNDGYNIASVAINPSDNHQLVITFARAMANAFYAPIYSSHFRDDLVWTALKTATQLTVTIGEVGAFTDFDLGVNPSHDFEFVVFGRQ